MRELLEEIGDLDREILAFITRGLDHQDSEAFNNLALRAFELQYNTISLYQRYCQRRGVTPKEVSSWDQVPSLPTDVFKIADLSLFYSHTVRTFMTSGTAQPEERGKIHYDEGGLRLMDATIRAAATDCLFPDGIKATFLIIAPQPDSSSSMVMSYGMDRLKEYFGLPQSRFLVGEGGFNVQILVDVLRTSEDKGIPVVICGGSFGFVNFFDYCQRKGLTFHLPSGSRCLDAGGFKGRSREIGRKDFLNCCEELLGIPQNYCVNLLGMTEIASQFYDNTLKTLHQGVSVPRAKVIPPWVRTVVVDPDTLEPLSPGDRGLLRHFDLANRGHICAIQTDDMGRIVEGGLEVYGRAREDETRGCALTIDEMTRVVEEE